MLSRLSRPGLVRTPTSRYDRHNPPRWASRRPGSAGFVAPAGRAGRSDSGRIGSPDTPVTAANGIAPEEDMMSRFVRLLRTAGCVALTATAAPAFAQYP